MRLFARNQDDYINALKADICRLTELVELSQARAANMARESSALRRERVILPYPPSDKTVRDGFQVDESNPLFQSVLATLYEEVDYYVREASDPKRADAPGSAAHLNGAVAAMLATIATLKSRREMAIAPPESAE
jgi:hypothetical protein